MSLVERAEEAAQRAWEGQRRREVERFLERAKAGRRLLKSVLGMDSTISDWRPLGQQAAIDVDGITLHTWRSYSGFGSGTDVLRFGDTDVRNLAHLGDLLRRSVEHSGRHSADGGGPA